MTQPMEENKTVPEQEQRIGISRFAMPLLTLLLFFATLPFLSFNPQEVDFIDGGLSAIVRRNIFGILGTHVTWSLLLTFGIATYPMILFILIASWRRMLCRRGLKR